MQNASRTTLKENTGLRSWIAGLLLFCVLVIPQPVLTAEGEYLDAATFLAEAFEGEPPEASMVWLTGEKGETVREILGHAPPSLRLRYWHRDARTAWILDEIGREKPITAGFVIENGRTLQARVLAFRESRGWEIRHEFFTQQFDGVAIDTETNLDRSIDSITGATMSVSAMKRMARVALYLDGKVRED